MAVLRVCADHIGEFAYLAVGIAGTASSQRAQPGQSLVLVRNERGRAFIERAVAQGYLVLESLDPAGA